MKRIATGLVPFAVLLAHNAFAACEMPSLVTSIPDGARATEQELLAAQDQVKAYIAGMDRYIACQNEEMRMAGDQSTDDYIYQMSMRIETARSEVDSVARRFNDQVNAFRAARQTAAPVRTPPPPAAFDPSGGLNSPGR